MTEGTETIKSRKIRTFGEKETYKYLETLEAVTIKQEKLIMSISGERENYSTPLGFE